MTTLTTDWAYTVKAIGRTQELTPEGFLLCRDVPIARTGEMLYAPGEIPVEPGPRHVIQAWRDEEDLFRPETIASFNGKPVTSDHPGEGVTPVNWQEYAVGMCFNARRGEGAESNLLFADLLITDQDAIEEVQGGKRQVSCGYKCDYEQTAPGRARQRNIIGNHVALVKEGRAGPRCAIGDSKMATKKSTDPKNLSWKDRIKAAFFTRDEAGLTEALEEAPEVENGETHVHVHLNGSGASTEVPAGGETKDDEAPEQQAKEDDAMSALSARIDAIEGAVSKIADAVAALGKGAPTGDADKDDDKKDDGETNDAGDEDDKDKDDKGTQDSAALAEEFRSTVARAEILSPGLTLPTMDAKSDAKSTRKAISTLQRSALKAAYGTAAGKAHIAPLLAGRAADFDKMTNDALSTVFNGATELARLANNRGMVRSAPVGSGVSSGTKLSDMNKKNREFWATGNR